MRHLITNEIHAEKVGLPMCVCVCSLQLLKCVLYVAFKPVDDQLKGSGGER